MQKKRTAILIASFFTIQAVSVSFSPAGEFTLNPPTKVNLNQPDMPFKDTCEIFSAVLSAYRDDAFSRVPKTALDGIYRFVLSDSNVRLDLKRVDRQERWVRCYSFSAEGKKLVARIFPTENPPPLSGDPVISELVTEEMGVTVQILPSPADMLKDCAIKPVRMYSSRQVDSSS